MRSLAISFLMLILSATFFSGCAPRVNNNQIFNLLDAYSAQLGLLEKANERGDFTAYSETATLMKTAAELDQAGCTGTRDLVELTSRYRMACCDTYMNNKAVSEEHRSINDYDPAKSAREKINEWISVKKTTLK